MDQLEQRFAAALEHHRAGRLQEAGQFYQEILAKTPDHAPSLHLLGVVALQIGRAELAANLIGAAVEVDPGVPAYRNDLGEALRAQGDPEGAARCYEAVIALAPDHAGARVNLGIVRQEQGRFADALALYERAAALRPDLAEPWSNLGALLLQLRRPDEAEAALETARRIAPDDVAVRLNLGNVRLEQGRYDEAVALYEGVLAVEPDHAAATLNLGRVLKELGRPAEALRHYRHAETLAPADATVRWNLGICRLLLGDWARGWQGFEARFAAGAVAAPGIEGPTWTGGPLTGTLLIHAEQGLGDTIQFARFIPLARERGVARIVLACQRPLMALMAGIAGLDAVVPHDGPPPAFDAQIPMMSLAAVLGATAATIPPAPYLAADPLRVSAWADRLGGHGLKIGVVWQGHRLHRNDHNRSLPAGALAPLLTLPGIRWFSLQKEPGDGDLATLAAARLIEDGPIEDGPIENLAPDLADFAETAAAIAGLDLVIAVDTAVAHLAGALGRPVWLALPYAPDWRWLMARADSPWYGSVRLFRQAARGDWRAPIAAMRAELERLVRGTARGRG
jgi:tetratricopeptide (TPR) repeat protein